MPRAVIRPRRFDDYRDHGAAVREQAVNLSVIHKRRRAVLGVDPKLVLVFELEDSVEEVEFRRSELSVLDASERHAVVAFADDPQLAAFLERVDAYRAGAPPGQSSLPYEAFLDSIRTMRPYGLEDRITERLRERIAAASEEELLRVDVECWHPGNADLAQEWLRELGEAVSAAGGRVVDDHVNDRAALVLARAYLPASRVDEIAQLDQIARIDDLPNPGITAAQAYEATIEDLPAIDQPEEDAPIVALIDSGVRSAHPMIGPALLDATTLSGEFPDGEDESGHGTRMAGLLLHGRLEEVIARGFAARPHCRLLSVRVLGLDALFPNDELWEKDLETAIRYASEQGARIVNLSIADAGTRYRGPRSTPVAALLDQLARELGIVIVVAGGNVPINRYSEFDADVVDQYPARLVVSEEAAILDPATSALALTVGGICSSGAAGGLLIREIGTRRPVGVPGWPSPFSPHGPGIGNSVKPELVAAAGSAAFDIALNTIVRDTELEILTIGGSRPERLLEFDAGTSCAAALASRVAAAVVYRYPDFGPNLTRALVLQALAEPTFSSDLLSGGTLTERHEKVRQLLGYGEVRLAEAIESTDHRVVLVAENEILVDGVHVYEIPMPSSFFESGGVRGLIVTLAFDPDTRSRRLDYLSSKMTFHVVRGMSPDEVEQVFLATPEEEVEDVEEAAESDEDSAGRASPLSPSNLGRRVVKLEPGPSIRSRGANQLGRRVFRQRLPREEDGSYLLVVRNTNGWATEGSVQPYAVAVALWRDPDRTPLYGELQTRLEVPVEVEVIA